MKAIGFWQEPPPHSTGFLDETGFEAYLQSAFLPAARKRIAADDLPEKSQVGLMALRQYDYHSSVPEAFPLMRLLHEFDDLVMAAG